MGGMEKAVRESRVSSISMALHRLHRAIDNLEMLRQNIYQGASPEVATDTENPPPLPMAELIEGLPAEITNLADRINTIGDQIREAVL